jgi:hypothetical protein
MMAITTNSSISVKPERIGDGERDMKLSSQAVHRGSIRLARLVPFYRRGDMAGYPNPFGQVPGVHPQSGSVSWSECLKMAVSVAVSP